MYSEGLMTNLGSRVEEMSRGKSSYSPVWAKTTQLETTAANESSINNY